MLWPPLLFLGWGRVDIGSISSHLKSFLHRVSRRGRGWVSSNTKWVWDMKNVTSDEKCWVCPSEICNPEPNGRLWESTFVYWEFWLWPDELSFIYVVGTHTRKDPCWWRGWDGQTEEMMPAGNKRVLLWIWHLRDDVTERVTCSSPDENGQNNPPPPESAGTQKLAWVSREPLLWGQKTEMPHGFLFLNILICLYLESDNTVNIDNKSPLARISVTWHQVPHKRICIIVQERVKNTDTVSSQVNEVILQYLSSLNTTYFRQQLRLKSF